jgi:hypothetical protein
MKFNNRIDSLAIIAMLGSFMLTSAAYADQQCVRTGRGEWNCYDVQSAAAAASGDPEDDAAAVQAAADAQAATLQANSDAAAAAALRASACHDTLLEVRKELSAIQSKESFVTIETLKRSIDALSGTVKWERKQDQVVQWKFAPQNSCEPTIERVRKELSAIQSKESSVTLAKLKYSINILSSTAKQYNPDADEYAWGTAADAR